MSSTTASKLPVRAARSADGPSPTATTSMPSAVSPRATAVRTPGSSSTTSTRAIGATYLRRPPRCARLRSLSAPMRHAVPMAGRRTVRIAATIGIVGRRRTGTRRVAGGAVRPAAAAPGRARGPGRAGAHRRRPGTVQRHGRAEQQPRAPALPQAPQAANGTSTARIWSGGNHLGRVALPTDSGERTLVSDGTTPGPGTPTTARWSSAPQAPSRDRTAPTDPAAAATQALADLRATQHRRR